MLNRFINNYDYGKVLINLIKKSTSANICLSPKLSLNVSKMVKVAIYLTEIESGSIYRKLLDSTDDV